MQNNHDRRYITCEFTEADWEWWYAKEAKMKEAKMKEAKPDNYYKIRYKRKKEQIIRDKGVLRNQFVLSQIRQMKERETWCN